MAGFCSHHFPHNDKTQGLIETIQLLYKATPLIFYDQTLTNSSSQEKFLAKRVGNLLAPAGLPPTIEKISFITSWILW